MRFSKKNIQEYMYIYIFRKWCKIPGIVLMFVLIPPDYSPKFDERI